MKFKTDIYFLLGAFILLNACAVSNPVSETVMFKEAKEKPPVYKRSLYGPSFWPLFIRGSGGYLNFHTLIRDFEEEERVFEEKFSERNTGRDSSFAFNDRVFNPQAVTIGYNRAAYKFGEYGAWSFGFGVPYLSLDATVPLYKDLFGTLNIGFLSGEVILQQKIVDRARLGISLGAYYHLERRLYIDNFATEIISLLPFGGILPEPIMYNHHIGIRSIVFIPVDSNNEGYGVLKFSYIENLDIWAVGFGFTVGFNVR